MSSDPGSATTKIKENPFYSLTGPQPSFNGLGPEFHPLDGFHPLDAMRLHPLATPPEP